MSPPDSGPDSGSDPILRRWDEVDALFQEALALEPDRREAFLQARCGDDRELLDIVRELIHESDSLEGFLDQPTDPGPFGQDHDMLLGSLQGLRLGPFQLEEMVGRGGLGVVYRARRVEGGFDQEVAVKLLLDVRGRAVIRRFERERAILASLSHPGIATLLDGGTAPDGRPYLVMELVDGLPITRYCHETGLGIRERLVLFSRVCDAVAAAHARLVVHRDLKPSNILVTPQGDPKLLDFGIAKLLAPDEDDGVQAPELTRTGVRALSPAYASPEQVKGEAVAIASDVFQLGTLLYELLTGRRPHAEAGLTPATLIPAICEEDPPAPSTAVEEEGVAGLAPARVRSRLEGDLDTIVLKALRKEPDARYGSVVELADDVRRHLEGLPVRARAASRRYRLGKFVSRNRLAVAVAAFMMLGVAAGVAGLLAHSSRMQLERDRAQLEARRAEAVTGFLMDLFEDASESGARDTLTVGRLLSLGEERLVARTDDPPEVRIELLDVLQTVYGRIGSTGPMQRVQQARVDAIREYYGPDHPRTAEALVHYGWQLTQRRQFEGAAEVFAEAVRVLRQPGILDARFPSWMPTGRIAEQTSDPDPGPDPSRDAPADEPVEPEPDDVFDPQMSLYSGLRGLSTALREVGRVDEALEIIQEYLSMRAAAGPDETPPDEVERDLATLAFVLRGQERFDEARELYDEALEYGRAAPEGVRPGTLNNYASLLRAMGRYDESEALFREAREGLWPAEGEEPPGLLDTVHSNLLSLLSHLGRHDEQLQVAQEALTLLETTHRADHWRVGRALMNVGTAYREAGACDRAEAYSRRALAVYRVDLGADHLWTALPGNELGLCLRELGHLDEAEAVLRETRTVLAGAEGASPLLVAANLEALAQVYQAMGRADDEARYRSLLVEAEADGH